MNLSKKMGRWAPLLLGFLFGCVPIDEHQSILTETRELRSTVSVLQGENDELLGVIGEWKTAYEEVEAELNEGGPGAGERLARAEQELEALRAKDRRLEEDAILLENEVQTLREDRDALSEGLRVYRTRLSRATQREERLERRSTVYDRLVQDLEREVSEGKIQISEIQGRLHLSVLNRILFPIGSAEINEEGTGILNRVGQILKGVEGKRIQVEGHTDNVPVRPTAGRFRDNWELSTLRATTVVRYLEAQVGLDPTLLSAVGFSKYQPVASNGTSKGRQQNRRIEIVITPFSVKKAVEEPQDTSSVP